MAKPLSLFVFFLGLSLSLSAQQTFPTPRLATVDLRPAELQEYIGQGKPTVIAIWATWCQPCHAELDHLKSYLPKWQNEYGAQFLAISVDSRSMVSRIKPLVSRKGWKYDVLVDTNGKLQSMLGFRSIPQMYVLDGAGKVVREFSGYQPGREVEVDQLIQKLAAK
ncbi:TlpA disulfide reductase family protein [Neolewinella lacunae]|uniref:TlpA family protein disulfide reductase n=1 Tax=Neolewinella lacunae TaxID=1517758 RepID=A0A923PFT2_9BACT|nr:TlpA disulfide reductase family protein [Neolewinella lacunae]MBC6993285.1 TlpA family protein disulfide reductase [Neolewinella lacunae]MDN3635668.1 TlpA disulfide reductase family protein [Neolewinella lacunae]